MGESNSVIVVAVVLHKSSKLVYKQWKDNWNVKKWYLILELSWLRFGDMDPPRDKGKAEANIPNRYANT